MEEESHPILQLSDLVRENEALRLLLASARGNEELVSLQESLAYSNAKVETLALRISELESVISLVDEWIGTAAISQVSDFEQLVSECERARDEWVANNSGGG